MDEDGLTGLEIPDEKYCLDGCEECLNNILVHIFCHLLCDVIPQGCRLPLRTRGLEVMALASSLGSRFFQRTVEVCISAIAPGSLTRLFTAPPYANPKTLSPGENLSVPDINIC